MTQKMSNVRVGENVEKMWFHCLKGYKGFIQQNGINSEYLKLK